MTELAVGAPKRHSGEKASAFQHCFLPMAYLEMFAP